MLLFLLMSVSTALAVEIEGTGIAVIEDGNVKKAEDEAFNKALKNTLNRFFNSSNRPAGENIPEITEEFYRFITSYRILERKAEETEVTYRIMADIDDIAINNINYYIREATNSAVFEITGLPENEEMKERLLSTAKELFEQRRFTTKYNDDFLSGLPDVPSPADVIAAYSASLAQYLFMLSVNTSFEETGDLVYCTVELFTKPYSRKKEFNTIKVVSKAVNESRISCANEAFRSSAGKTLDYVRRELIKAPGVKTTDSNYEIRAVNFGKFIRVKTFMDFLKRREIISDYKIHTFSIDEVSFEVKSFFDRPQFIKNIRDLQEKHNYSLEDTEGEFLLDFTYRIE